jgi:hypothetical protein
MICDLLVFSCFHFDESADRWRRHIEKQEDSIGKHLLNKGKDVVEEPASSELCSTCVDNVVDERSAESVNDVAGESAAEKSSVSHVIPHGWDTATRRDDANIGDLDMLLGRMSSLPQVAGRVVLYYAYYF